MIFLRGSRLRKPLRIPYRAEEAPMPRLLFVPPHGTFLEMLEGSLGAGD